jgi:DNA-binding NarL/FixJ family response regulator
LPDSPATTTGRTIRVVIGEDEYLMRTALEDVLTSDDRVVVVASCSDRDSVLAAVEEHDPDVVLTDIRMPPTRTDEGIQVAQALRESHPRVGAVVLSQFGDPGYAVALLESGSAGRAYLLKEHVSDPDQLISAIELVAAGGSVIDARVVEELVRARSMSARSPLADLTRRERDVLAELAEGKSNAAIADTLVLTKRAVEKHINAIFTKLNLDSPEDVSRRVKAALLFLASGESTREA